MTDGTEHPNPLPGQGPAPLQPWSAGSAPPAFGPAPDWDALADEHEAGQRRRKLWINGGIAAACVVAVAAGTVAITAAGPKSQPSASSSPSQPAPTAPPPPSSAAPSSAAPSPSASPTPSGSASVVAPQTSPAPSTSSRAPVTTATVPGSPNLLADHSAQANLVLGPAGSLVPVDGGFAFKGKSDPNAFAESSGPLIDTTRSFTVSAWVETDTLDGTRAAISQGDGTSFSFVLGREDVGGQKSWAFRVQTAPGTVVQVRGGGAGSVGGWALLTGTYDAGSKTIALYVGGSQVGSAKMPGIWGGAGPFELGRSRERSAWTGAWAGLVGHVQVWDRVLSPAEVATVVKSGGVGSPVHAWLV